MNDDYAEAPRISTVTGRAYDQSAFEEPTIFAPDGHCDYYGSKGFLSGNPALREALLRVPIDELALATVPAVCRCEAESPPALWAAADWASLEDRQRREPLFDWSEVLAQHAAQDYRRDGFAVFKGIMTAGTVEKWSAALVELTAMNDRMVLSDWRESVDWPTLRVPSPTAVHSAAEKQAGLGGAQQLRGMDDVRHCQRLMPFLELPLPFCQRLMPFLALKIRCHSAKD